jgi:hypothetical protein
MGCRQNDDPFSLQFKELGDVDFCVLLLYDGSISASYTRDLARFLSFNRVGIAQMEFASPDAGHITDALAVIGHQYNLPAEKILLLGIGDAAGHLAGSLCSLSQRVLGRRLFKPILTQTFYWITAFSAAATLSRRRRR